MFYVKCACAVLIAIALISILLMSTHHTIVAIDEGFDNRISCECPPLDGSTEFEQLQHYWQQHLSEEQLATVKNMTDLARIIREIGLYSRPRTTDRNIDMYTHIVSPPETKLNVDRQLVARIVITELIDRELSIGGSTFKIITRGRHTRAGCSYRDFFNGTYLACCVLHEEHNDIDLTLVNVNFLTYHMYPGHHKLLQTIHVASNRPAVYPNGDLVIHHPVNVVNIEDPEEAKLLEEDVDNYFHPDSIECFADNEFWMDTMLNGWRYVSKGHHTHFLDRFAINRCIDEKYNGHMTATGDSHMRYVFFYINSGIRLIGNDLELLTDITDDEAVVKGHGTTYRKSSYLHSLVQQLEKMVTVKNPLEFDASALYGKFSNAVIHIKSSPNNATLEHDEETQEDIKKDDKVKKQKELLLISTGIQDLAHNNSAEYILQFPKIFDVLKTLKVDDTYDIFWQAIPAWPTRLETSQEMIINTFLIGAINYWVDSHLQALGIHFVNMWKLSVPFDDSSMTCSWNYLCQSRGNYYGHVGKEAAQALIRAACET